MWLPGDVVARLSYESHCVAFYLVGLPVECLHRICAFCTPPINGDPGFFVYAADVVCDATDCVFLCFLLSTREIKVTRLVFVKLQVWRRRNARGPQQRRSKRRSVTRRQQHRWRRKRGRRQRIAGRRSPGGRKFDPRE